MKYANDREYHSLMLYIVCHIVYYTYELNAKVVKNRQIHKPSVQCLKYR